MYDPTHSSNMQQAYSTLNSISQVNDTPQVESNLLNTIVTQSWPAYRSAQQTEASLLQQILNAPGRYTPRYIVSQISNDTNKLDTTYTTLYSGWVQLTGYVRPD